MCNLINTHTHTHTHTHMHQPEEVNRNLAAEDNHCRCSSSLPGGLSMEHKFTCLLCGPGGIFSAGVGGMDRAPPARDNNGPASTVDREGRARGETAGGGKVRFGDSAAGFFA